MLRTQFKEANMPTKVREGGGQFTPYTSHVIRGGGRIRTVNTDTQSVLAGFYAPKRLFMYHVSDRV
jgi:hypothetical protein